MRPAGRIAAASIAAFALASSASAAYVCHPDPAGTRTLRLAGEVVAYELQGRTATLLLSKRGDCARVTWNTASGRSSSRPAVCATASARTSSSRGGETVEIVPGSADSPDRLAVRAVGRETSWPLPDRARHLDVDGTTALFSTRVGSEVYAVDLKTGRAAIVGLSRDLDIPDIEPAGIIFRDNLEKAREDDGTTLMKFVPRGYVERALRKVGVPLRLPGRVIDLAMDGSRVALAVRGWRTGCDAVVFWNVTWRYSVPITEEDERTCHWSNQGGSITSVSIGGLRAAWTMRVGDLDRVVSASSVDCFERIVATARRDRGERILGVGGDGAVIAYAVGRQGRAELGRLDERMRGRIVATNTPTARAVVVDGRRMAVLVRSGVELRTEAGALLRFIPVDDAHAIALRAGTLAVLTRSGTLHAIDSETGVTLRSLPTGVHGAAELDVHFGIAAISSGKRVLAVSLATGRMRVAATAPAPVVAQIEAPGIAYAYLEAGRSVVRFVPFAKLERLLGSR